MVEGIEADNSTRQILDYLRYYCEPNNAFDFAVMLKGPWGSGKTHLINNFLAERIEKTTGKDLYVSSYGLTSFRQIDDEFFRQLHPILSSKEMKLASKVMVGAIKEVFKVDFGKDHAEEVTINSQLPEVNLADYLKVPKECILVFDDLERCSIPIPEVLGYINAFVEHEGFKAIIVANEAEILKRSDDRYLEIKEKLVGQTFEVCSDARVAIREFIEFIRCEQAKEFLRTKSEDIFLILKQSMTANLRILKQSLWSFERLATCFSEKHWENKEAMTILFRTVLALSFETRSGSISEEQLRDVQVSRFRGLFNAKKGETADVADQIESRYPGVRFDQTILSLDSLKALLFNGHVDPDHVRAELDNSPYYSSSNSQLPWKTAWHIWDVEDDTYQDAVNKVEELFEQRAFEEPTEILHVFSLRLLFSDIKVTTFTRTQVVSQCESYIDDLRERGKITDSYRDQINFDTMNSWEGLGFYEQDSEDFQQLKEYYSNAVADIRRDGLPKEGKELLQLLKSDPQKFYRLLCVNDFEASVYYEVPILATIAPEEFVDQILSLDPRSQQSAFAPFATRYDFGRLNGRLKNEREWLRTIVDLLNGKAETLPPLSKFRIQNLVARRLTPLIAETNDLKN